MPDSTSEMITTKPSDAILKLLTEAWAILECMSVLGDEMGIACKAALADGLYSADIKDQEHVAKAIDLLLVQSQDAVGQAANEETNTALHADLLAASLCGLAARIVWDIYAHHQASATQRGETD